MTSQLYFHHEVGELTFSAVVTDRASGDMHPIRTEPAVLDARQAAVAGHRWAMIDQRHGRAVVDIDRQSAWPVAGVGDVVVSSGAPIGVWAADCAPLLLFGDAGTIVGVHAGWRGLAAGVVDEAIATLTGRGQRPRSVVLGPVIHACCYEFGQDDLGVVARGVHADVGDVTATTAWGAPALDVPAAVQSACAAHDVEVALVGPCTGCDTTWYSHRRREDPERHALVGWVDRQDDADV